MGLALGRNPFLRGSGGDTTPVLVLTACINDFDPVADSIRCATVRARHVSIHLSEEIEELNK
jgi:hypothetical protein